MIRAVIHMESHMLIETFRQGILLIHSQAAHSAAFDTILKQATSQPLPAFGRSNEKHLQLIVLYSHESAGHAFIILCSDQDTDASQRFRHIFPYHAYLSIGEEIMGCPHRCFPHFSQAADQIIISFFCFGKYHMEGIIADTCRFQEEAESTPMAEERKSLMPKNMMMLPQIMLIPRIRRGVRRRLKIETSVVIPRNQRHDAQPVPMMK